MLDFVKTVFRGLVEIAFWIILIVCTIVGYILGNAGDNAFVGAILGMLVGLSIVVLSGGFIATILAIEENTAKTEANTAEMLSALLRTATTGSVSIVGTTSGKMQHKTTANSSGSSDGHIANEQGRTNVRSWWDSDGDKHESWEDADGTRHET